MKRISLLAIISLVALAIAACGTSGGGSASASWRAPATAMTTQHLPEQPNPKEEGTTATTFPSPLSVQVIGTCASHDGTGMRLRVTGLTPNGPYQSTATYPDGSEYTYLLDGGRGRADAQGNAPHWSWNCNVSPGERDPAVTYHLRFQDLTTHETAETDFVVSY